MITSLRRIGMLAVAGLAFVAGCSSEPTNPAPVSTAAIPSAGSRDLLGGLTQTLTGTLTSVAGVQRTTPLASNITVSQTIGYAGGTLSIPAAGVKVTIPVGALSSPTLITMTARSGSLLAYDFAPHGITFAKPLVFTQSLSGTSASLLTAPLLQLGYYSDPSLLTAVGGLVSELIGGTVNLLSWTFTSNIRHFSGYMVSMGRSTEL
ncbi:MAG: hypothetical protein ABJA80_15945 [bacterium]